MQAEEGRRKCGVLFVSLIVLWHQYLIFSLRTFPIVSAEPRKLLISEKGRIYASIREGAEWRCSPRPLVPSPRREPAATLLFIYPPPHPPPPPLHGTQLVPTCAYSLSHGRLFATLWTVAHQAPLSMGFSRQEYRAGKPFPSSPGDFPDPGIGPASPALQADSLPPSQQRIFSPCPAPNKEHRLIGPHPPVCSCTSYFPSLSSFF